MTKEEIRDAHRRMDRIERSLTATKWLFWIAAAGIWTAIMWQAATYYFGRI